MPNQDPYANSAVEGYANQLDNPAAPAGLHQDVEAAQGYSNHDDQYANSAVGKYASQQGYTSVAPTWFTGANTEGTNNGWSTTFTDKFIKGQDAAAANGTLSTYFSQPDATGVVTWDHQSPDGRHDYHFGDVYEDGKKVANLFDPKDGGFDRDTANLMMAAWVLDGTQQARVLSDSDRMGALDRAIQDVHESNNVNIPKAQQAFEFNEKVQDRAEDFESGHVDDLIVGGGALGGAGVGAGIGTLILPGVGTAVGGGLGGLIGGVGALLNKDELTQQAARAYEITALAHDKEGTLAGITTGLQQWAGFSTQLTSPVTNIEHGLVELTGDNKIGDAKSAYYGVDKHGDSTRPAWAKPLSLAANLVDGVTQFVSPVGRAMYTAQMAGQIGGDVGTLASTGGKMFDPREGGFDNIFVDDDGNFDPTSAAAGIMKVGIDAVQLGGWRGLAAATGVTRREVALGARETEAAGYRFSLDEAGNVLGKKATLSILAPSEQIAAASAARKARVAAQLEGRAVTADDFYKAATGLATGSNRIKRALVNGFGEGYEEALQGLLEPIALDGKINPGDVIDSFLQGAATGTGFSLGATAGAPTQDARLKNQALVLETLRRGGEAPEAAEWDKLWAEANPTQKRVMASRNESDIKAVQQALGRVAEEQAATIVASTPDAAKALDARRSAVESALKTDTTRTDAYHVMSGLLDADSGPAESVHGSALTIARLLEDRTRGLAIQAQSLAQRAATQEGDEQLATQQLLDSVELSRAVGANLTADVLGLVNRIYDDSTTVDEARQLTDQLNALLEGLYDQRLDVVAPAGAEERTPAELKLAAAKFVTLLHSREPKLDSGSYLALLPRVSWQLTADDADNLLQVSTDMLSSINGDFDGDKLRAEYQLVLSDERFAQARAGQLLGGRAKTIDVVARNFDLALTRAIATSAAGEDAQLRDEANGTLAAIETVITDRYGSLMSPAALARVFDDFRTAVFATEDDAAEEARVTLLNSLAREAGGAITELGRSTLRNEWLWISQQVRSNFDAFQNTYRVLRAAGATPSATAPVADIDTPEGTNARKAAAVNDAQTLAVFAVGNTLFRKFQKIHYTFYNAAVLEAAGAERADLYEMAALYEELSRGVTRSELEQVTGTDQIGARVLAMLHRLVDDALSDPELAGTFDPNVAMSVLANVRVKDVQWLDGEPVLVDGGRDLSLVQLLLKRALDADAEEHAATFDTDEKLKAKHARLRAMTFPNTDGEVNAERAFIEVFAATPFADSMGRITGSLAPHTTPEQWLRNYISLDAEGRRDMERLFTNVPEYLDRAEKQNLPYAMSEALNRSVTPYRSMLDALMAVGRSELTFDPSKAPAQAFGGRRAETSQRAQQDFIEGHTAVLDALRRYRQITNRTAKDRVSKIQLVQDMLEANPVFARNMLELIPNAAANAVFEARDGELYVARWVYEMFTIEDPKQALFFYWKNLTLAQWNATLAGGVEGRKYAKLNSRFQRLLYQLDREPGQLHLELLLREMDKAKDLDEFFVWLNTTPGFRGQQAVLLPFNDDVAEFEADAGGGWVTSRASSDLRAAITAMRNGALQLRNTMEFREEKAATDKTLRAAIRRARNGEPDGDYEALRRFERAVQISLELPRGFAPTAMLALTSGAMRGFDAHSHDKGVTADSYAPLGEFQALMDAFAFVPGLERTMEVLTAHSISSLTTNVGDLGKDAGTAMDAHGRQIEWSRLTVDEALDMLDDPRTEPLALALLSPQALDLANGKLSERLLTEASLKDLLDSRHYSDLFNLDGDGSLNNAMRYLSILDSRARAEGGHFDVLRYVNALAVTRLSALTRESTEDDRVRVRNQTYLDVARALQLVGQVQATPELRDAGTLEELSKAAVKSLRDANSARRLPGFTDAESGTVVSAWVEHLLNDLEAEQLRLHQEASQLYSGAELTRQAAIIDAQYEANAERIRSVLEDDLAAAVAARFRLTGDPARDAAARAQIVEYAMSTAAAGRMPESIEIWSKLAAQREAGRTPELTPAEWDQLSRSVMGLYLTNQLTRVAGHVSTPEFGKGDPAESSARFFKYFDPAYAFIATDLLSEGPMAAAAAWLHTTAEQPRALLSVDDMTATLKRTILNDTQLGSWTPAQMSQIAEIQQRMDSAPVAGAIAAAGNGPKRWAAIAYATKRNAKMVPGPELLTTVSIPADMLEESADPFNEVEVVPAGHTEPSSLPIAQLDNRFVAAIRINGQDVPLDTENLGFVWHGEPGPSGYRYVALDRLRPVVARLAAGGPVEIDFFHPDSRPAGEEWVHNVYFDGMAHSLLPDDAESLIAAFWSANAGQISTDTQRPLDAGKKGLPAMKRFARPDAAALAAAEEHWNVGGDLAALLRAKTELLLSSDDDVTTADYNALYKMLSLQHIVVGTEDGRPVAWTAEQVIAHAAANGKTTPLPLEGAKLVKLSPDVLRTMLGETGDQGVPRFFEEEYLLNPDLVSEYTGVTTEMINRFPGWFAETGKPGDTALANVGMQRVLKVRTVLTDAERNARQQRIQFLDTEAARTRAARYANLKGTDARDGFLAVLRLAIGSVSPERNTFDFMSRGVPIAPRNVVEASHTMRLLEALKGVADRNDFQRGWRVVDQGTTSFTKGELNVESLDEDRPLEHRIVKDDVVLLELSSFELPGRDINQVHDRVERTLRYLVNTGATIVLGSGNGGGDLRDFADRYLRDHGYPAMAGSRHMHAPAEFMPQTQNERAYESTLTETRRIRPARVAVTFQALDPIGTDENAAVLNPASRKLRTRKLLNNLLPTSSFPHYNVLLDDNADNGLYAKTLAHLRTITDPAEREHREALLKLGGTDPERIMPLSDALDRLHDRITNRSSLVPEVGDELAVGDIVPFVHPDGKVIFYRHGFKLPRVEDLQKQFDATGINVALAPSETEPAATANSGVITEIDPRAGYGRTLQLETPLQAVGDKIQLEWNGMKYVVVPPSQTLAGFLAAPIFANGTQADLFSDYASAKSKEAYEGLVLNYRNALAFFQFDFTDDLVKFFYPDESTRPPQAAVLVYSMLSKLASQSEYKIPLADAAILAQAPLAVADQVSAFAGALAANGGPASDWTDRLGTGQDATSGIARAVITYLLTHDAHIDNVLKSAGFSHAQAANDVVTTRVVPGLFADLLDQGLDSAVHTELIRRFDAQLARTATGAGYKLHPDWTVEVFDGTGSSLRGYLQFGEAHSSGDNPLLDGQAYDPNEKGSVSAHNAMAAALSLGAITASNGIKKARDFAKSFTRGGGVVKPGTEGESIWQLLTALPDEKDSSLAGWRRETPAETVRRALARQEIVGFYTPLTEDGWTEDQQREYASVAADVLRELNLYGTQRAMVDAWVRMHLGRPSGVSEEGHELGVVKGADAVEIAKKIRTNVTKHLLPTAGANVPLIDVNHLTTIYLANLNRDDGRGWAPRTSTVLNSPKASSWDAWVETAFGTAWILPEGTETTDPAPDFHQMFLLAVDGLMHGYQDATTATRYLPVSSDSLRARQLMDAETNRMLVSISRDENLLATDPTLFNASAAQLDEIIGGQRIYGPGRDGADPSSAMGQQDQRFNAWHKEVDAPRQRGRKMRDVRAPGQTFLSRSTKTSAFWRSLINLRVGNVLFNLQLITSAIPEAFYRRTINTFANIAAGESTGAAGRLQSRLAESLPGKIDELAKYLGVEPTYTAEEQQRLHKLVDALSTQPEFKAMVYKELMHQYPSIPGIGRVEKWLEKYAKFGARIQDPTWGMLPKSLARLYVETAMRRIAADPTGENIYSVDRLLTSLARNPEWLETQDLETHNMAIAAIANVRSLKPNVISLATRGIVEPLAEHDKFLINSTGNMLRLLTTFQNFWANSVINMTGMQGVADFAAFHFDGRRKTKLIRRYQAALKGEAFVEGTDDFYDMSEILEGLDLADSFIRGGITHTALFTLGMAAGSLGLTGEDDEERWRRRAAELQGAGFVHDPRKAANDFRNKGAIFLNWLPLGLDSLFKVNPADPNSDSLAQMNWTMRYFASPVLGFERFYQTGDFSEIIHGFGDALGSHPIVNAQLWNEATATASELHAAANDAVDQGDHAGGAHLLITAVGVMERMAFENSMLNMLYVGTDRYDRDPYKLPALDSDGNPQVDVRGNPYQTNSALQDYVDDNGTPDDPRDDTVKQRYVDRDPAGALFRSFTENRFGLAFLGSLYDGLTGGSFTGSDFFRENMPIKTRKIELAPQDQAELESYLLAAFQGAGGQHGLSETEAAQIIKNRVQAAGGRWDAKEVEKLAADWASHSGLAEMSRIENGREVLTDDGRRAIFDGLRSGAMTLGTAPLNGVYMTKDQRDKIRDDLVLQITQEGVDLGLSKDQAMWRMRRIVFGTGTESGTANLIDLLYTDQIPWTDTLEYNQLNTTYVTGPTGYPMATGFTRDGLFGALGLKPLLKPLTPADTGLDVDGRMNAVDQVAGINTGLRGLEPRPQSWEIPSVEDEIRKAADQVADAIKGLDLTPSTPYQSKSGSGGYGGGGRGGYSGGGGSYYSNPFKLYSLPGLRVPYGNSIPFINTSNPIIRRADVRRERVWSERGRLKQWQ